MGVVLEMCISARKSILAFRFLLPSWTLNSTVFLLLNIWWYEIVRTLEIKQGCLARFFTKQSLRKAIKNCKLSETRPSKLVKAHVCFDNIFNHTKKDLWCHCWLTHRSCRKLLAQKATKSTILQSIQNFPK